MHCKTEKEAIETLGKLKERFEECRLELHPTKTKIVYCKDKDRVKEFPVTEFDFPGYTFKQVYIKDKIGRYQFHFLSFVSKKSAKNFRDKLKAMELHEMTGRKIEIIAKLMNPMIRGWLNYLSAYCKSAVKYTMDCLNRRIVKWAMSKYKRFKGHRNRAELWLKTLVKKRQVAAPKCLPI